MHKLRSLCSEVELIIKQIDNDLLNNVGRLALRKCFGGYLEWKPASGQAPPTHRRFAGDETLPRGCYYTVAADEAGNDEGTLFHELLAYASYGERNNGERNKSFFQFLDLCLAYQKMTALELLTGNSLRTLSPHLDKPGLLICFLPTHGQPHPFKGILPDEFLPSFILIELSVKRKRFTNVIDLRIPEVADDFCKIMTRYIFEIDGIELPCFPNNKGLNSFRDILPTILNQDLGGGYGFCSAAGLALRKEGVDGLVYPSVRSDAYVEVVEGVVVNSGGWNFVDYMSGPTAIQTHVIDMDPWRKRVCKSAEQTDNLPNLYNDVRIDYRDVGRRKGSWSIQNLAVWQEAFFELGFVPDLIAAIDPDVWDEMKIIFSLLLGSFKTGAALLSFGETLMQAALGSQISKNNIERMADLFAKSGARDSALILRRFIRICP